VARRGLVSPGICHRWLPVWLPRDLASLANVRTIEHRLEPPARSAVRECGTASVSAGRSRHSQPRSTRPGYPVGRRSTPRRPGTTPGGCSAGRSEASPAGPSRLPPAARRSVFDPGTLRQLSASRGPAWSPATPRGSGTGHSCPIPRPAVAVVLPGTALRWCPRPAVCPLPPAPRHGGSGRARSAARSTICWATWLS
jgi:hypothetical protein